MSVLPVESIPNFDSSCHRLNTLKRIFKKTTLTTQRSCHGRIIDLGNELLIRSNTQFDLLKSRCVNEALRKAREEQDGQLNKILKKLYQQLDQNKRAALLRHKQKCDEQHQKVVKDLERKQQEMEMLMRNEFELELKESLRKQAEELSEKRSKIIAEACGLYQQQLKNSFAYEREQSIAKELNIARNKFKIQETNTLEKLEEENFFKLTQAIGKLTQSHQELFQTQLKCHKYLQDQYTWLLEYNEKMESNFLKLQLDYMELLDNSQGYYHSDYMIQPRRHVLLSKNEITEN